jgi:methylase of polypeptide subunit release factors
MSLRFTDSEEISVRHQGLVCDWTGSSAKTETSLHQLSPYIGKIKSSMAASLVESFTKTGELVYDPFSGSGTVALECWLARRRIVANDLSPYAHLLTRAKLFPYASIEDALAGIESVARSVRAAHEAVDLRAVPGWVRQFFHPKTLREILAWTAVLKRRRLHFLFGSLLGILHHQRPGFLSFPSSHTVPYLRLKKFPRSQFPDLYEYRSLRDRLEAKVKRAMRRVPELDLSIERACLSKDAVRLVPSEPVDAIITSPPYMRQLDYGRDNRLRLWFLGAHDWKSLDKRVSPGVEDFLDLMRRCFRLWRKVLKPNGLCVLVVGDGCSRSQRADLPELIARIAAVEVGGYSVVWRHRDTIPDVRRVRRQCRGNTSDTILVLAKT